MAKCAIQGRAGDVGIVTPMGLVHCALDDDIGALRTALHSLQGDVVKAFAAIARLEEIVRPLDAGNAGVAAKREG